MPGAENAGKPGYYTVKPKDTLIRIALDNGQDVRDLVRWNSLANPNLIEVGQVLRVLPPGAESGVSTAPVGVARVEARPLDAKAANGSASSASSNSSSASAASAAGASAAVAAKSSDDDLTWDWPSPGTVIQRFDEVRNKGIDLRGKPGDPVYAAASGRVIVMEPVRGYGNTIVIKHVNDYLSVYAHNQTLLVKKDQVVRKGQKIAEMGSSDADQVKLHFEIRKGGNPLDPSKLLPPR